MNTTFQNLETQSVVIVMIPRTGYIVLYTLLAAAVGYCAVSAMRSKKNIGRSVGLFELSLIPAVIGHIIIIAAGYEEVALVGYYFYFIGMNCIMASLIVFTNVYCKGVGTPHKPPYLLFVLLGLDSVQLLLNIFWGHAFSIESDYVDGRPYYRLVAHGGQVFHRVLDYAVVFAILLIFIMAIRNTPKIYREKYTVIFTCFVIVLLWESFYVFTRTPIDRSVIGFAALGILVWYFSLKYRPLRLLDRMLSDIAAELPEALFVFDPFGKCVWTNELGMKLAGVTAKNVEDAREGLRSIFGSKLIDRPEKDWTVKKTIGTGASYSMIMHSVDEDSYFIAGSFLSIRDVTEEQLRLQHELYNSTHDSLTGLFTKQHLYECIRRKLEENPDTPYYAVFVDVKNFKIVNDVFSTRFGDLALIQIADWIRPDMTERCVYGRLGGDTFGVFVPVEEFKAEKIERELESFVVTDGSFEHHLLIHLGIYEVTDKDMEVSVMFDRAHLALSTITEDYKRHIAYYDNDLREKVLFDQQITSEVRDAVAQMQIRPYFQPIADALGRVIGAEALARWIHPERGFMSPASFIPVFEKNGMIVEVDRHIWRCACRTLSDWKSRGIDLFLSVNISPKDFYFIDVVEELTSLVREYDIEPLRLRIEITETVMMSGAEERLETMDKLREAGFIVEMDDFGSGYSSLSLLKDMPVDVLKIDMKFLSDTEQGARSRTIVHNVIRLSEELGIVSLTEGVETEQQYRILAEMGCRLFQGYYFAKPMPAEEFEEFAVKTNKLTDVSKVKS